MNAASQWSRIFFVLIRSILKKKYFSLFSNLKTIWYFWFKIHSIILSLTDYKNENKIQFRRNGILLYNSFI
jgi:hypothetical protein